MRGHCRRGPLRCAACSVYRQWCGGSKRRNLKSFIEYRIALVILFMGGMAYVALRTWLRNRNQGDDDPGIDFCPAIGFTRLDGWASLAVLLSNKSDENVWTEEIEIALADISATDQTAEASGHAVQKIRQTVQPHDMLPVSLVESIYKAAGKPQRRYSCVMSSMVRYRVGEKWYEKPMQPYKLKMAGLTIISNHREPWTKSEFKPANVSHDHQPAPSKTK
jgi:hypothetical protein